MRRELTRWYAVFEPDEMNMAALLGAHACSIALFAHEIHFDGEPEEGIWVREEVDQIAAAAWRLHFTPKSAAQHAPERCHKRIVEPNNDIRLWPGNVVHRLIIAVHNPAVFLAELGNPRAELLNIGPHPIWLPVERVQIVMRQIQLTRKILRERGLPGATCADDEDVHSVCRMI